MQQRPLEIIESICDRDSMAYRILVDHGRRVADKSLRIAARVSHLNPDVHFIEEVALLHDIGMVYTDTPKLGCFGKRPYVCHGVLGRELLEDLGMHRHALVCERHVGVGISRADIRSQKLPLPDRDMRPQSIEEQIICYADKFYSKNGNSAGEEKPAETLLNEIHRYGSDKVRRFQAWIDLFESRSG